MSSTYERTLLDPEPLRWCANRCVLTNDRLQGLRDNARRRLVSAAVDNQRRLLNILQNAGLSAPGAVPVPGNPDVQAMVLTGHQPVIFHSGLTFKYTTTEEFAVRHQAIPIAIIIDSDEGDAGAFAFPAAEPLMTAGQEPRLTISHASFSTGSSLFSYCRLKSPTELLQEAERVINGLNSAGCHLQATRFGQVAQHYAALPTDSIMDANLVVRWAAEIGAGMPELPLTSISAFPETLQFFAQVFVTPFEFVACYNNTLQSFRKAHRIRNDANPFPDLPVTSLACELPFWLINPRTGTRETVSVRRSGSDVLLESDGVTITEILPDNESASLFSVLIAGRQLVPRGALITATLRLLFGDLFVHGTGGAHYDQFTDVWIREWWKVEPTPFAVASASRYLFDEQRQELSSWQAMKEQLREMQFNPARFFGTGVFSAEAEVVLRKAAAEKEDAIAQLRALQQSHQSAREVGQRIQQLSDSIKAVVLQDVEPRLAGLRELSPETLAAWTSRTWPWFFF